MAGHRPAGRKRARSVTGKTPAGEATGRARIARGGRAHRRTVQDNPATGRARI